MRKYIVILIGLFILTFSYSQTQIIADHTVVDLYDDIPSNWIDSVKTMWLSYAGESHSSAIRDGLTRLEDSSAVYAVSVIESGTPESPTSANLRASRATWGDIDNSSGWIYTYGEEDWGMGGPPAYTLVPAAVTRTSAGITYCNAIGNPITVFAFGHCYDDGINLAYSYVEATKQYIEYCADSIPTTVIFTTGPVDGYLAGNDAGSYEQYLKWEIVRDSVDNDPSRILFDYADIISYNNDGEVQLALYDGNYFPVFHDDNDDEPGTGHIGNTGANRLAKAMWWTLARIAGWDGELEQQDTISAYYGDIFVAPADSGGSDLNPGTFNQPYETWQKAFTEAGAGDTVYFRAGTYYSYAVNTIDSSGTSNNPICYFGYPGDIANGNWPVLDCIVQCDSIGDPGYDVYNSAIYIDNCEYLHFKNLEITNVFQCDSVNNGAITSNEGANLTFEQLRIHNVASRGFYITSGAWGFADSIYVVDSLGGSVEAATPIFQQPDTTMFINCDVYDVCDTFSNNPGNAGDGYKIISYIGNYFYWYGCRAWQYSDDGFDPNKGQRVFENCWAMSTNKYEAFTIEGNGFKSSSLVMYELPAYNDENLVQTRNCLAVFSPGNGFYHGVESDTTDNPLWYNNTAWKCGTGFGSSDYNLDSVGDIYRNNLVYGSTNIGPHEGPLEVWIEGAHVESNNTWDRTESYPYFDYASDVTVTDADFITVDSSTIAAAFKAPRNADGSLPTFPIRLATGSDLINAGVNVGISFNGSAPDIGAWESNYGPTVRRAPHTNASGKMLLNSSGRPLYIKEE
jgi:hypothetical protein